jgi:hypothetical protein
MDFIKDIGLNVKDQPKLEEAEVKLDLRHVKKEEAVFKLNKLMKECEAASVASLYVFFNPATQTSGETLFQPVGNILRQAKKDKIIRQCLPVMNDDDAGFYAIFNI